MKITSRFTIAVHTLLAIHVFAGRQKTTSEFLATSVNVNPVVIRRILQSLKAAGLVAVKPGSGGAEITKDLKEITLYDVYCATGCINEGLFHFHENPNPACPVGRQMHCLLDGHLAEAQSRMENSLKSVTLADLVAQYEKIIAERR